MARKDAKQPASKKGVPVTSASKKAAGKDKGKDGPAAKDKAKKAKKGDAWKHSQDDDGDLEAELAAVGLRVKDITGDGNCFFRALGDQLQGDENLHVSLRQRVLDFIEQHEEDFAPFVEDDEPFAKYVARMRKDGTWAGYMEVVAASRCLGANLTIYQAGQPRWHVVNHPDGCPVLHLSYHDGQHYNSVRCADDFGHGPPAPVLLTGPGTIARPPPREQGGWDERDEARVMSSTGCGSRAMVRRALEASKGDVEAAIEQIIERMAAGDEGFGFDGDADGEGEGAEGGEKNTQTGDVVGAEALEERAVDGGRAMGAGEGGGESGKAQDAGNLRQEGRTADGADGGAEHRVRAVQESVPDASGQSSSARAAVGAHAGPGSALHAHGGSAGKGAQAEAKGGASGKSGDGKEAPAKGPSNNKPCPCGSKKKYKACCGPAAAAAARRRQAAGEEAGSAAESQGAVVTAVVAQVAALVI